MKKVVDAKDQFKARRSAAVFARLLNLADEAERSLLENPGPYLERAAEELYRLRSAVDIAIAQLNGSDLIPTTHQTSTPTYVNLSAEVMRRNSRATETLIAARNH